MEMEEAIARVDEWLRSRTKSDHPKRKRTLRVQRDYVSRSADGWHVPYNAAGYLDGSDVNAGIFPPPVVFVPDDGGEIHFAVEIMAAGGGRVEPVDEETLADPQAIVDPEFDQDEFGYLGVPERAILGWHEVDPNGQRTGAFIANPKNTPGPEQHGFPIAQTPAEKLWNYYRHEWIDRRTYLRGLLACEILIPFDEHGNLFSAGGGRALAFSSSNLIMAGYVRWRRIRLADFIRDAPEYGIILNMGRRSEESFYADEIYSIYQKYPIETVAEHGIDEVAAEISPEIKTEIDALRQEVPGGVPPSILDRRILNVAGLTRKNGYELTVDECRRYLRGYVSKLKQLRATSDGTPLDAGPGDLADHGLTQHYDEAGQPKSTPWTFGKFFSAGTPDGNFAWHRIVGAYIGLAIGEALSADVNKPVRFDWLTSQLLFHTEGVIRGLSQINEGLQIPMQLSSVARHATRRWLYTQGIPWNEAGGDFAAGNDNPDGWLANVHELQGRLAPKSFTDLLRAALNGSQFAHPALLTIALAATVPGGTVLDGANEQYCQRIAKTLVEACRGDDLVSSGAEVLVSFYWRLLGIDEFAVPVRVHLWHIAQELGSTNEPRHAHVRSLIQTVLALRDDRHAADNEQLESIGDGHSTLSVLGRALFVAAKRDYDPRRAMLLSVNHSGNTRVTGALVGAMVGARVGVPGLPAEWVAQLGDIGLVENIASDAFYHFNRYGVIREPSELSNWERRYPHW